MPIPWSDVLTGLGLLLNIAGVAALTITDLFSRKPIRTWWFFTRHVDREHPEETEKEPPVGLLRPMGGGYAGDIMPNSPENYDKVKAKVRNQAIAVIGLIGGFFFQFVALLV